MSCEFVSGCRLKTRISQSNTRKRFKSECCSNLSASTHPPLPSHTDTHTDTQTHTHARTHAHAHAHTLSPFCRFLLRAQEEEQFSSQPERRATLAANGRISFGRVTAKQGRNGKTTTTSAAVAAVSPSLASELLHPDAMFRYLLIDVGEEGDSSLVDDAITRICAQPSGACALSVLCFWVSNIIHRGSI